jgi:hypothetical protein
LLKISVLFDVMSSFVLNYAYFNLVILYLLTDMPKRHMRPNEATATPGRGWLDDGGGHIARAEQRQ